jgi:hypothetical protein
MTDWKDGWEKLTGEFTSRGAIAQVYGNTGTGRTRLVGTCPGPIAQISFDENGKNELQKVAGNKEVVFLNIPNPLRQGQGKTDNKKEAQHSMDVLLEYWIDALEKARTINVDTDLDLVQLTRVCHFGAVRSDVSKKGALEYEASNRDLRLLIGLIRQIEGRYGEHRNVIFTGCTVDEWVGSAKTGDRVKAGRDEITRLASVVFRTTFDKEMASKIHDPLTPAKEKAKLRGSNPFGITIEKGGTNGMLNELRLPGDCADWGTLMGMITDTDPEEWRREF